MYIDVVPNRNSPPAVLLRECFREGGRVVKRTLANLSGLPPVRVEALRRALRGDFDQAADAADVSGPVFGVLYALAALARQTGLARALGPAPEAARALFLVLARVAAQGSRLSAVRWAAGHAVQEVLGRPAGDEDALYAALDWLAEHQERIELALWRQRPAGAPVRLFLYDVTSVWLEGQRNALAAFGYERSGRKGKRQLVVGLLADAAGEPVAVRVFAGNTADPATVPGLVRDLAARFGVRDIVFVGDRGMVKRLGKDALTAEGFAYVTALTDPQIRALLRTGVLQLGLFDDRLAEVRDGDRRLILRRSPQTERRERRRLEDKLARLAGLVAARNARVAASARCRPEAGLGRLRAWAARHRLAGVARLELAGRELRLAVDAEGRRQALLLAGCYVVETNAPAAALDTAAAHAAYRSLAQVERGFRTLKSGLLEIRPVFVRKASRTRGHVFACFLALRLARELERRLAALGGTTDASRYAATVPDALLALSRLSLAYRHFPGGVRIPLLPSPDPHQTAILDLCGAPTPIRLPAVPRTGSPD